MPGRKYFNLIICLMAYSALAIWQPLLRTQWDFTWVSVIYLLLWCNAPRLMHRKLWLAEHILAGQAQLSGPGVAWLLCWLTMAGWAREVWDPWRDFSLAQPSPACAQSPTQVSSGWDCQNGCLLAGWALAVTVYTAAIAKAELNAMHSGCN